MNLRRLTMLREIARRGSMSAAAHALSYSTSSVSEQVAVLEREVGVALLERGPRGVRLTRAGRLLADRADEILDRIAAARAELDDLAGLRGGEVHVGAFPTAGSSLLSRAAATFQRRHPGVSLRMSEADPEEAVARLAAGELDVALVYEFDDQPLPVPAGIEQDDLLRDTLHLAMPVDHPAATSRQVRFARLARERWVQGVRHGATAQILPAACRAAGFEPHIVIQTDDPMTVQGFVAAGLGIALIPELLLPVVRRDIAVRPLRPALRRTVRVARRARSPASPAQAAMVAILRELSQALAGEAEERLTRP